MVIFSPCNTCCNSPFRHKDPYLLKIGYFTPGKVEKLVCEICITFIKGAQLLRNWHILNSDWQKIFSCLLWEICAIVFLQFSSHHFNALACIANILCEGSSHEMWSYIHGLSVLFIASKGALCECHDLPLLWVWTCRKVLLAILLSSQGMLKRRG